MPPCEHKNLYKVDPPEGSIAKDLKLYRCDDCGDFVTAVLVEFRDQEGVLLEWVKNQ